MQERQMTWEKFKNILLKETHTESEWREIMSKEEIMQELSITKHLLNCYREKEEKYNNNILKTAYAVEELKVVKNQLIEALEANKDLRKQIEKLKNKQKRKWWQL